MVKHQHLPSPSCVIGGRSLSIGPDGQVLDTGAESNTLNPRADPCVQGALAGDVVCIRLHATRLKMTIRVSRS